MKPMRQSIIEALSIKPAMNRELCATLGRSRNSVRDALNEMVKDGRIFVIGQKRIGRALAKVYSAQKREARPIAVVRDEYMEPWKIVALRRLGTPGLRY